MVLILRFNEYFALRIRKRTGSHTCSTKENFPVFWRWRKSYFSGEWVCLNPNNGGLFPVIELKLGNGFLRRLLQGLDTCAVKIQTETSERMSKGLTYEELLHELHSKPH